MSNNENTFENNEEVKSLVINKDEDGNFKSEVITLNDGTKVEFVAELENNELTKTKIFRDLQAVEEELCGTHDLTNHADTTDYLVSVGCGILCGLIDSFFVGEFDFHNAISKERINIDELSIKLGKFLGYKNRTGDKLKGSITKIENTFKVANDNAYSGKDIGVSATSHHLDDWAHHPSALGFLSAICAEYLRLALFTNKDGKTSVVLIQTEKKELLKIWCPIFISGLMRWFVYLAEDFTEDQDIEMPDSLKKIIRLLSKTPAIVSLLKTSINWVGHLLSDINGSSSTPGSGMGIPGLYLSFLKEIASILGNSELNNQLNDLYQNNEFDMRKELASFDKFGKQAIPIILGEILVRGFYLVRNLIEEYKIYNSFESINWKNIIPFKNRTVTRMLTISKGTFEIFDIADAAIRSGGFTNMSFLLHLNFIGAVSFCITTSVDIKMGIQKFKKEHAYGCPKNLKLIRLYKKNADGLSKIFETVPSSRKSFGPLFIHIDEKQYERTNIKVMFVGMENHLSLTYDESMQTPKKLLSMFEMYKDYKFSPANAFGNFAKKLTQTLNTSQNNPMFIWNSIYKFSKPNKEIESAENQYFNLLVNEIKICRPDAVIFMTGKKYDKHIQAKFNNKLSFSQICINSENSKLPDLSEKCFAKLVSNDTNLPKHIYRISKPNSLFFKLFRENSTVNWLIKLILGIEPEQKEKKHKKLKIGIPWKALLVIPAIILLLLLLRTCNGYSFIQKETHPITSTGESPKIKIEEKSVKTLEKVFLKETKSFEFRADRRDFVNPQEAKIWFDNIAKEINTKLKQNPNLKFKICGYVAEFQNEIDEMVLAKERAENIKKGLVKRGIPSDILIVIPVGKTSRWGTERRLNRAVTIESFEE